MLAHYVSKKIPSNSNLDDEVSYEEVKQALFSIHLDKAQGPDGFNAYFFHKVWHIVGDDLVAAIQSFFTSGHLLRELNNTAITLIPKSQNPTRLLDFRPISCCNTIYKCISKIIANRIKGILPNFIDKAQSAFIQGRRISDNILLAQELMHNYHRKDATSRSTIKVDILKAFDTVSWTFILDLLDLIGIPCKVIRWIRACMTSPSFSININGELEGFF